MRKKVMIVDDQKLNIDMLAEALSRDYIIMPATSGEGAIKLLKRKIPDIVLLDVYMPNIDGFEVLRFMKETEELSNIPVIFVTGEHDSAMEEKGLALGAVDYVKKPFNLSIVSVKVQNHLENKTYRDGLELLVQKRTKQLYSSNEAIIMGMSLMSERHDSITGEHISRIKEYTKILTNKIVETFPEKLSPEMARKIVMFSPLHDVGKIAISDVVLKKTGLLTKEEFNIIKSHTYEGAELLKKTELFLSMDSVGDDLKVAIEIAESHHEKYDGTGYPHQLKADAIPISARIVSVVDVYDALRSPRQYKKAFTHSEAMKNILGGDERTNYKHFDPMVLDMFVAVQDKIEEVYV